MRVKKNVRLPKRGQFCPWDIQYLLGLHHHHHNWGRLLHERWIIFKFEKQVQLLTLTLTRMDGLIMLCMLGLCDATAGSSYVPSLPLLCYTLHLCSSSVTFMRIMRPWRTTETVPSIVCSWQKHQFVRHTTQVCFNSHAFSNNRQVDDVNLVLKGNCFKRFS